VIQAIAKGKKGILPITLTVFLVLCLVYFSISTVVQYNEDQTKGNYLISRNQFFLQSAGAVITSRISRIVSDLLYTKQSFQIMQRTEPQEDYLDETSRLWCAFADTKKVFDQIRYLDMDGNEVLRVNYDPAGSYAVAHNALQNKKSRYYFTDSINLPENHVYISCIDLNVENGQIENPIKPTIRLATPVFDGNHQGIGLIVMNYFGNDLFQALKNILNTNTGEFYMLNSDGYWLFNSEDNTKEWTFMYPDLADISFSKAYPEEWNQVQKDLSGTVITDKGAFVYSRVLTKKVYAMDNHGNPLTLGAGDWYIVSRIPLDTAAGMLIRTSLGNTMVTALIRNNYVYLMILLISAVIGVLLAIARAEREQVKFFSEFDTMTGALNRRAGLEKLNKQFIANPDRRCQMSICFLDINGLKEINDTLGHEAGDELIRSVTETVRKTIRANDLLIRMGGDEFMIVFDGLAETESELAWSRIVEAYENINHNENRPYVISVSHGIEIYHCNSNMVLDTIVNQADAKMYEEKRELKKNLHVVRATVQSAAVEHDLMTDL